MVIGLFKFRKSLFLSILILIIILMSGQVISRSHEQRPPVNLQVETKIFYGFIYPHHAELDRFYSRFPSMELSIQRVSLGNHAWEQLYNNPDIGISFFYSGLGGKPELKEVYALMPFINFPLFRAGDFSLGFRLAVGASYFPHPYDSVDNPFNQAIGTHINAAVNLMFDARFKVNHWITVSGGVAFQHFSNGGWKMPNFGLNIPVVNAGIAIRPYGKVADTIIAVQSPYTPSLKGRQRFRIDVGIGVGYKNAMQTLGQNFMVLQVFENSFVQVSPKSSFGLGIDIVYDPYNIAVLEKNGQPVGPRYRFIIPGINAGYALGISRLIILLNLGLYPGNMIPNGRIYEKLSLQYQFNDHLFAQLMLKAHMTAADYVSLSFGYTFRMKKRND